MRRYIVLILISFYLLFIAAGPVQAQIGSGIVGDGGKASDMGQGKSMPGLESTPTETAPPGRTITLDDNGKTITLRVNETFLLQLGEGYDWDITVDDQTVLSRKNVLVIRGAQGIYEAHKPGRTTLTAVGDPPCRRAEPPCAAPSRLFRLDVVVAGAATPEAPAFEAILAVSALFTALWVRRS